MQHFLLLIVYIEKNILICTKFILSYQEKNDYLALIYAC